jgi:hypothetical protein
MARPRLDARGQRGFSNKKRGNHSHFEPDFPRRTYRRLTRSSQDLGPSGE